MTETLQEHCEIVADAFTTGRVVPFLGAGANLCGRPEDEPWSHEQDQYLPSGDELAGHLAEKFRYPPDAWLDLVRVSQYADTIRGAGPLYDSLHALFDGDFRLTPLHQFLASLPSLLKSKGCPACHQLVVTTNYDDLMERAFVDAGEPFDVVSYLAEGKNRGSFVHLRSGQGPLVIRTPNEYLGVSLEDRSLVLKVHGTVDRFSPERDWQSFVITENHYIDYLTHTDIAKLIPAKLVAKLTHSHFLFLGYSLRDWNLRAILHRIWGEQKLNWKSWAIQHHADLLEKKFWAERGVDILQVYLQEYVTELSRCLQELPDIGGTP